MELFEALITRRSIRQFTQNSNISEKDILFCINAAMYAPSARNYRSWQFYLTENKQMLHSLANIHPYGQMLNTASWAILICNDENIEPEIGYGVLNVAAATQNLLLALHDKEFGAVWLGVYPRQERMSEMSKIWSLPNNHHPISLIAVGIANETPQQPVRNEPEKIHVR